MKIELVRKLERPWGPILAVLGTLVIADAACGGGTPPPATPEPAAQASAAPAGSNDPAAAAPQEAPKSSETAASSKPPPQDIQLEKPTRPVRSIIESADTVYFVSYEESDVGKTGE